MILIIKAKVDIIYNMVEKSELSPIEVQLNGPRCPTGYDCEKTGYCYLSQEPLAQSDAGGFPSPQVKTGAGPYWPRDRWNNYVANVLKIAPRCLQLVLLNELLTKVTEYKDTHGELL